MQINWPFWGAVQLLTFSVVPQPWRVAWISVVHVFWNAFLSSMNQAARIAHSMNDTHEKSDTVRRALHEPPDARGSVKKQQL